MKSITGSQKLIDALNELWSASLLPQNEFVGLVVGWLNETPNHDVARDNLYKAIVQELDAGRLINTMFDELRDDDVLDTIKEQLEIKGLTNELCRKLDKDTLCDCVDVEHLVTNASGDTHLDMLENIRNSYGLSSTVEALASSLACSEMMEAVMNIYDEPQILASIPHEDILDYCRDEIGAEIKCIISREARSKLPEYAVILEKDDYILRIVGSTANVLLLEVEETKNRYIVDGDEVLLATPLQVAR